MCVSVFSEKQVSIKTDVKQQHDPRLLHLRGWAERNFLFYFVKSNKKWARLLWAEGAWAKHAHGNSWAGKPWVANTLHWSHTASTYTVFDVGPKGHVVQSKYVKTCSHNIRSVTVKEESDLSSLWARIFRLLRNIQNAVWLWIRQTDDSSVVRS